jgi:predicted nucleotidyltransferase
LDLASIGDALFSKTQQKVLGLLYGRPDETFYLNEIVRLAGVGKGTVNRELDKMLAAGLVTVSRVGNQNHYQANAQCPIYDELLSIVRKTIEAGDKRNRGRQAMQRNRDTLVIGGKIEISRSDLQEVAKRFHIRRLYLFGSAARGELRPDSDIDLLIEFESNAAPSMGGMVEIQDAFAQLFHGRKVDVATPSILNNPYRKRAIEKDMEELYAA